VSTTPRTNGKLDVAVMDHSFPLPPAMTCHPPPAWAFTEFHHELLVECDFWTTRRIWTTETKHKNPTGAATSRSPVGSPQDSETRRCAGEPSTPTGPGPANRIPLSPNA
jgi:hypothetical protein